MKKKTSVSIDNKILAIVKREAAKQDRSVSYILEKFIEEKAKSIVAEKAKESYGPKTKQTAPPLLSRPTRPFDGSSKHS